MLSLFVSFFEEFSHTIIYSWKYLNKMFLLFKRTIGKQELVQLFCLTKIYIAVNDGKLGINKFIIKPYTNEL